ncbi:hypothetical protein T492DRAFT_987292 [Pavlovales sp. CCMP2436]|nr:hypothetical protein T492DRAFT_987292 [Pavlovales sp. CCMP2436]|mmetsp:Transcript_17743/g.44122  ORF Transcript_17743/g.44122 Transcript_17743/m.44122 type:complete len:95 (+) Transcript_17743:3-287(+)
MADTDTDGESCVNKFDAFMFCMTPTNQLSNYYTKGIADWCPVYLTELGICLQRKTKLKVVKVVEREDIGHIWHFKPAYAGQATELYGTSVQSRE